MTVLLTMTVMLTDEVIMLTRSAILTMVVTNVQTMTTYVPDCSDDADQR